jgi:uncharacterized coiled-coil protein SlyX
MLDISGALQAIDAAIARLEATAAGRPETVATISSLRARQRALLEELVQHLHADTSRLREELHQQHQRNASLAVDAARLPVIQAEAQAEIARLRDALRTAIDAARFQERELAGDPEKARLWRQRADAWTTALGRGNGDDEGTR